MQTVLPRISLEDALSVPEAIHDQYGGDPTPPLDVAGALQQSPQSSAWKYLTGAVEAYGLTTGAYNAQTIALSELGRQITSPTEEGQREAALRKAALTPSALSTFLRKYDGKPFPRDDIAKNVLIQECDVPRDRVDEAFDVMVKNATFVGFFTEIKGKRYVKLRGPANGPISIEENQDRIESADGESAGDDPPMVPIQRPASPTHAQTPAASELQNRRVFITHGKKRELINQLKEIVSFGKFEPIVSVESESTSVPVPEKVMEEMRSCFAGVIHVAGEENIVGEDGKPRRKLNDNVLIEIGAAMALYRRNFILLVQDGVQLPSNLQGLYECRYSGDTLDGVATMKLLKAFNSFKFA